MTRQVLFLCTANFYRSRFAEHFFNWLAAQEGLRWRADSCGLAVDQWADELTISQFAVDALAERGVPLHEQQRRPRQVTEDDLARSQLVVALKEVEHRPLLTQWFPSWAERVEYWHVDDIDCAPPDEALPVLEDCLRRLVQRVKATDP